jgi:hypothetical protein
MKNKNNILKKMLFIATIIGSITLFSCNKIKNKGQSIAAQAEEKVKDKADNLVDKIVPQFDSDTPDTKHNKARFNEFLQIELTPDIKNIYCFADRMGADSDFQFSFNCNAATVRRIIEQHKLVLDKDNKDFATGLQHDFDWWNKKDIAKLPLYMWKGEKEYFKYFWYDKEKQKAYFFDFDL